MRGWIDTHDPAHIQVSLLDMVLCLVRGIELLHPAAAEHHLRVACIASSLAEALGMSAQSVCDVMIAGALHDVAAVCAPTQAPLFDDALTPDRLSRFRTSDEIQQHGEDGYRMLRDFAPFSAAAQAIRYHHVDWADGEGATRRGCAVPMASHLLRLADRAAVVATEGTAWLAQIADIRTALLQGAQRLFHPEVVRVFADTSQKEAFWLDIASPHKEQILRMRFGGSMVNLDLPGLHGLSAVFGRIIDYRSSFTATHSSGVAASAEYLAARLGLPCPTGKLVGVAGFLHDIGKLVVPPTILDKPSGLTPAESLVIRQHPYYTHQILATVAGLESVTTWASLHHERLDGTGYPFRARTIPLGSRIIAVADIFTATTENRPYRSGMDRSECLALMDRLVQERAIDGTVVEVLRSDFDALRDIRHSAQQQRQPNTAGT